LELNYSAVTLNGDACTGEFQVWMDSGVAMSTSVGQIR